MRHHRYAPLRYSLTLIFSFLLFLFLTAFITGFILLQTVFNASYMEKSAERSGFSGMALAELHEIYTSLGAASGIPADIMVSAITHRDIDNAIKDSIRDAYRTGTAYSFETYENDLYETFRDYAMKLGMENTEELSAGLRELAKICTDDFKAYTVSPVIDFIGGTAYRYERYFAIAVIISAVMMVMTALLLRAVNRRISKLMRGYIYAFGACAIVCAAIPAVTLGLKLNERLGIRPMSYNRLFSFWLRGIAEGYLYALIPVVLLLAAFVTVWIIRRRRRKRLGA